MITDNIAKATNWNFIRRLKQVLSVALHDTGSQRVQWRRPSTCCFSASFVWLHAPSAGLLMMTNVSRLLVEVCSHKKPGAHRVMRFSGARQSVSSASNVQVFPVLGLSWNLITVYESQPLCQLLIFMALFLFAKSISFGINTFRRNSCFLCVCLPKIDLHTLTDITILLLMCFMGQCQCLSEVYLF